MFGQYFARDDYTVILTKKGAVYKGRNQFYHGISLTAFDVDPDTVGQYTGLTDKNGKRIFEGDIVDCFDFYGEAYYDPDGCFDLRDNTPEMCGGFIGSYNSLKVIGNIYDNPELLEVGE